MQPRLLRAPEVAQILQVSVLRVYELARLRALPCVRIGRSVRIPDHALMDWIAAGGTAAVSETLETHEHEDR